MSEPIDRNKTALTHSATATAAGWLEALGAKPIEDEVGVAPGWIADLAAMWEPTMTEAKRSGFMAELLGIDQKLANLEGPQQFARLQRSVGGRLTILVEVKTSKSDLAKDMGRKYGKVGKRRATMPPPAHLCVLACPRSIAPGFLHDWAVLELSENCRKVLKARNIGWYYNAVPPHQIEEFLANLAVSCDHRNRHAAVRKWMKAWRADEAERRIERQHSRKGFA